MAEIKCMPLKRTTDGPLFGAQEGTLSALTNMRLRPGGYAEARGGFEEDKPNGGTPTDAISAGAYSDVFQTSTSYGWIRSYDDSAGAGSQYSGNLQFTSGRACFANVPAVEDAMYWGADAPFSRIGVSLSLAGAWASITLAYEYYNGSIWTALTTAETIDFTVLRTTQYASWTLPTSWAAVSRGDSGTGNVYKYWMRIRITALSALTASPRAGKLIGFWTGMRELYAATQSPLGGATSGTLKRQGQSGTTREWFSISTSLFSANASPARMAEYRGRLIFVNGKEVKRWDGFLLSDLGISGNAVVLNLAAVAGGVLGAGVWRYYAALGDGPCQNTAAYADRQDAQALYGQGRALYQGEVTTAAGQRVRIENTAGVIGASSSIYLYRTDDLTNMAAADRATAPAYLIQSFRAEDPVVSNLYEQGFGGVGNYYYDDSLSFSFPLQEAYAFDIAPPGVGTAIERPKYLLIYQNRLMLGDDETWYISDPFQPDRFSTKATTGYIRLARAKGGRHMGGIEFADQAVLYTEDQTWGLSNVDLDVPQLFPIHPTVGCIAPDAIASGDGALIWPARDGFYMWDGTRKSPFKISGDWDNTFGKMSFETHGGSRAVINDRQYIVRLCAPGGTPTSAYAYDMDTGQWYTFDNSSFSSVLSPMATIHAPLGNNDYGAPHTIWGKTDYGTGAGEYGLFLGELTTQDAGSNYTCSATMYFPIRPVELFSPTRAIAYYQASDGWGTPSLANDVGLPIGSSPGTLNTGTPDTATDYRVVGGTYSASIRGTSDIKVAFTVSSAAGGTVNGQRLFGAIVEGEKKGIRRGMI